MNLALFLASQDTLFALRALAHLKHSVEVRLERNNLAIEDVWFWHPVSENQGDVLWWDAFYTKEEAAAWCKKMGLEVTAVRDLKPIVIP